MNRTVFIAALIVLSAGSISAVHGQAEFETQVSSYGLALPSENVVLRSSIETYVEKILVREGQHVKKGDVLVQLHCDSAIARKNIARLEAEEQGSLLNAEAELKYAKSYFKQISALSDRHAVNVRELNEARLRLESARAKVKMESEKTAGNQARYALATAELEDHFLRAPFDGQITHLHVYVGDSVVKNTDILQLISADRLRVELYVPIKQAASMQVGDSCQLEIQEPFEKQTLDAQIVFKSPMIEATTGTLRLLFEIDNRGLQLPAGFTVAIARP